MTKIFDSYSSFLDREDKGDNGVSQAFADAHPNYELDNSANEGCWNCSGCSRCSRCSRCSDCSDCSDCSGCSRCSGCSGCSGCSRCSDMAPQSIQDTTPVIPGIHGAVFAAASRPDALNMGNWHTCETTHCRAGWVVHLAGEAGKQLESSTSTLFAAMQIYHASSPITVSPTRFFGGNAEALADMQRCAEEEAAAAK